MCTRIKLAEIAKIEALRPFHGTLLNEESNIQPIVELFQNGVWRKQIEIGVQDSFIIAV